MATRFFSSCLLMIHLGRLGAVRGWRSDHQLLFSNGETACPWNRGARPCFGYTQTCLCNDNKVFGVNILFSDSAGENLWLYLNRDILPHVYFRDQQQERRHGLIRRCARRSRKAFEECKKAREKEMQELLACYVKDRRGSITQINEVVPPLIDSTKVVHRAKVSHPSTSVTLKDVSAMFFEHVELTRNMVGDEVTKSLAKFSQNSKYQPTTFATTHPMAPNPSATPSTSVTQPPYGMLLNYFSGQTPLAHKTAMTLHDRAHTNLKYPANFGHTRSS
jgi:hypothetical protein